MNHPGETHGLRRRTFLSGLARFGFGFALCSSSLLVGCGGDTGQFSQVENPTDPTKSQGGMDSMKAYQSLQKEKMGKSQRGGR
jgi:hypothetical protein